MWQEKGDGITQRFAVWAENLIAFECLGSQTLRKVNCSDSLILALNAQLVGLTFGLAFGREEPTISDASNAGVYKPRTGSVFVLNSFDLRPRLFHLSQNWQFIGSLSTYT